MGNPKKHKVPGELREVLAQNINRMMEHRYKESGNRPMALAREAGVSLSSVQRTLSRETGVSIDTLEAFAKVFGLPPFQLLVPWGLLGEIAVVGKRRTPLYRGRLRENQRAPVRKRTSMAR
jgi:transcriptional regulator with XRE-family HTH domain